MITVKKRDGFVDNFDESKIKQVIAWACEGVDEVSPERIYESIKPAIMDGMSTKDIQQLLVKNTADMITEITPNYDIVAGRLLMMDIRKDAYKDFNPDSLLDHLKNKIEQGVYDKEVFSKFTVDEIDELDNYIKHDRDFNIRYAGAMQWKDKYLVQNRTTGEIHETPNMALMLIAMALHTEDDNRIEHIKAFYDAVSTFKISLPTPIMAGVRTPTRQFASCCVIDCEDSLDSINASNNAIIKFISQRAGIGINGGAIRAIGEPVRGGEVYHTGVIPFYKTFLASVKSSSQGGIRGGAATLTAPIWHYEIESILVLKNNKGTEENRVRHLDYSIQLSKLFWKRLAEGGLITLFSPNVANGKLYEYFFTDQDKFEELYVELENDKSVRKKHIKAIELFSILAQERIQTGRIYIMNVDNVNNHTPFDSSIDPIRLSNLCQEIDLPTKPIPTPCSDEGEIALCVLSAINMGVVEKEELEDISKIIVRALDNLLDYQEYPVKHAEEMKKRRSLGIGVTNYAYFLAKNGEKYTSEGAKKLTHEWFESMQYYLMKASLELAKEKGACEYFDRTLRSKGIMPIDTYAKELDKVANFDYQHDWGKLSEEIVKHGMRNSTLTAIMPCETSSQVSNSTNGIEPPRSLITVKASKTGIMRQVVPEIGKYEYETAWEMPKDNKHILILTGIMQKFVDQGISINLYYDPSKFEGEKLPISLVLKELMMGYKLGMKQVYYHNTRDGANEEQGGCEGNACAV